MVSGVSVGAGYRQYPYVYYFEEYGVPQSRRRLVMVGLERFNRRPFDFRCEQAFVRQSEPGGWSTAARTRFGQFHVVSEWLDAQFAPGRNSSDRLRKIVEGADAVLCGAMIKVRSSYAAAGLWHPRTTQA